MLTFFFWNVGGKTTRQLIASAVLSVDADCAVLCECPFQPSEIVESLNEHGPYYRYAFGECEHVMFFTKFQSDFIVPAFENPRISIRHLKLPARNDVLIAAAHLPSRLFASEQSLAQECFFFSQYIEREEATIGHRRTIVMGDLNVNPFEMGVVGAGGLHAVSSRTVAAKGSRVIQSRQHHFFYNPMWAHFGDRDDGPPGTYYYERAEGVNFFWNIYDQILLRPELLQGFDNNRLRILTTAGAAPLLDRSGQPDRATASDHLPVVFGLDF